MQKPDQFVDVVIALGILVLFGLGSCVGINKGVVSYKNVEIDVSDEDDLFLLNFLRTEIELIGGEKVKVVDLIIKGENDAGAYELLQGMIQQDFQRIRLGNYGIRISYEGQKDRYIPQPGGGFKSDGSVMKLPSLNGGVIGVEANLFTEEEYAREVSGGLDEVGNE